MLLYNEYVVKLYSWEAEQISILRVKENKTCLKKYQPGQSPQQKQSELDGGMTPDLISGYFWQVSKSCPSVKLSNFCGDRNALKVINERCITTSLDVAKVHSLITFNES